MLACERGASPRSPAAWQLLDSAWVAPWDEMIDSVQVYGVGVGSPGGVDTLVEVLTPLPVVADDSTIWGLRRTPGRSERELFRWRRPNSLRAWPLPSDMLGDY